MTETNVQIIPANPGFKLLELCTRGEESDLFTSTIIGWAVDVEKIENGELIILTTPVTVDQLPTRYAIMEPSGQVVIQCESTFEDKELAFEYMKKNWK